MRRTSRRRTSCTAWRRAPTLSSAAKPAGVASAAAVTPRPSRPGASEQQPPLATPAGDRPAVDLVQLGDQLHLDRRDGQRLDHQLDGDGEPGRRAELLRRDQRAGRRAHRRGHPRPRCWISSSASRARPARRAADVAGLRSRTGHAGRGVDQGLGEPAPRGDGTRAGLAHGVAPPDGRHGPTRSSRSGSLRPGRRSPARAVVVGSRRRSDRSRGVGVPGMGDRQLRPDRRADHLEHLGPPVVEGAVADRRRQRRLVGHPEPRQRLAAWASRWAGPMASSRSTMPRTLAATRAWKRTRPSVASMTSRSRNSRTARTSSSALGHVVRSAHSSTLPDQLQEVPLVLAHAAADGGQLDGTGGAGEVGHRLHDAHDPPLERAEDLPPTHDRRGRPARRPRSRRPSNRSASSPKPPTRLSSTPKRHAFTHSQPRSSIGSPRWASSQSSTARTPSGPTTRLPFRKSPWTMRRRRARRLVLASQQQGELEGRVRLAQTVEHGPPGRQWVGMLQSRHRVDGDAVEAAQDDAALRGQPRAGVGERLLAQDAPRDGLAFDALDDETPVDRGHHAGNGTPPQPRRRAAGHPRRPPARACGGGPAAPSLRRRARRRTPRSRWWRRPTAGGDPRPARRRPTPARARDAARRPDPPRPSTLLCRQAAMRLRILVENP